MRRDKELTLEITSQCTLECDWCSSNSSLVGTHVSTSSIFATMRECQPLCKTLRLSGGEPLLHPDIRAILYEAKHFLKYHVVLMTNGQEMLDLAARDQVDEFVVHMVNGKSFATTRWYSYNGRSVSMHVVAIEGNEANLVEAINFANVMGIPLHVLALQKQGRGVNCEPSKLITWSGEKGCSEKRKVTVLASGAIVTCSAMKRKCDIR